ncbi:hypothetical protein [Sandaracinus amylolyticus]|nr:hypothetical protein [Sandaracinus amylolyticus]
MEKVALAWLCSLALVACGGDDDGDGTAGFDAGRSGIDAQVAPGVDSGTQPDAYVAPGTDAGGADAYVPPGTDAGGGGGDERDPRLETDPDPGQVGCGSMTCNVPAQTCCTQLSGQTCVAPSSCSGGLAAPGNCDGPEDCSDGQLCCAPSGFADLTTGTTCAASCGSRHAMCQTDADCSGGATCHTCRPPGGMGGVVGLCNTGASCPGSYTSL